MKHGFRGFKYLAGFYTQKNVLYLYNTVQYIRSIECWAFYRNQHGFYTCTVLKVNTEQIGGSALKIREFRTV